MDNCGELQGKNGALQDKYGALQDKYKDLEAKFEEAVQDYKDVASAGLHEKLDVAVFWQFSHKDAAKLVKAYARKCKEYRKKLGAQVKGDSALRRGVFGLRRVGQGAALVCTQP